MNRSGWIIVAVLAGLSCGFGIAQEPAQQKTSNEWSLKEKIVALTLMSDSDDLVLLSGVSERQVGGKSFLSGEGVDDEDTADWRNGAVVYIPVDDIQQMVVFSDLKAYKKNLNARQNRAEGKAASMRLRHGPRG